MCPWGRVLRSLAPHALSIMACHSPSCSSKTTEAPRRHVAQHSTAQLSPCVRPASNRLHAGHARRTIVIRSAPATTVSEHFCSCGSVEITVRSLNRAHGGAMPYNPKKLQSIPTAAGQLRTRARATPRHAPGRSVEVDCPRMRV